MKTLAKDKYLLSVIARRPPVESDYNNSNVCYWTADVSNQKHLYKVLTDVVHQNGKLNNLIFFQRFRGKADDWTGELETSLTATKHIIDYLIKEFDETTEKSIVIISSIASFLVAVEQPLSYHVAKAGLNQMVRYYAFALGPKGIRVNGVMPGPVLKPVLKEESREFHTRNKQLHDLYEKIIPLGRMGTSEEIANVVSFLCSSKASFITGQNIIVDGGLSLQSQDGLARKLLSLDNRSF